MVRRIEPVYGRLAHPLVLCYLSFYATRGFEIIDFQEVSGGTGHGQQFPIKWER